MTVPEIVSLVSTILLTSVALVVGVQLIFVLRELHRALIRTNQTIDTVSETLNKIAQPALGIMAIIEGFKESGKIIESVSSLFGNRPKPAVNEETYDDNSI